MKATPPCTGTCGIPSYKGDNYCDDENNNCGCDWDGGDCCGSNVNTYYCSACECLDPHASGSRKKQNLNETISKSEKKQEKIKVEKYQYHHGKHLRSNDYQYIDIQY